MNKDRKIKIAVLMGGPSAEHNVSLATGKMILGALDKSKYFAKGIVISRNGRWPMSPEKVKKEYDVAFIAMHGAYGEDGQIQSLLEKLQIPYTGSNSFSSWLGMNKPASLELFKKSGLAVPKFVTLRKEEIKLLIGCEKVTQQTKPHNLLKKKYYLLEFPFVFIFFLKFVYYN